MIQSDILTFYHCVIQATLTSALLIFVCYRRFHDDPTIFQLMFGVYKQCVRVRIDLTFRKKRDLHSFDRTRQWFNTFNINLLKFTHEINNGVYLLSKRRLFFLPQMERSKLRKMIQLLVCNCHNSRHKAGKAVRECIGIWPVIAMDLPLKTYSKKKKARTISALFRKKKKFVVVTLKQVLAG